LKILRVTSLELYPRFHHQVREDLLVGSVELIELRIGLGGRMKVIQTALMDSLYAILQELKRLHPSVLATLSLSLSNLSLVVGSRSDTT